jgi:alpha-amylase
MYQKKSLIYVLIVFIVFSFSILTDAEEQPIAIFHAFDQSYNDVSNFVCELARQGYSHVQIAPAQRSNPREPNEWFYRYQPVEYGKIEGRGSNNDLKNLIDKAKSCKPHPIKIIADVVFNHMASSVEFNLNSFPEFKEQDFHKPCSINFNDGNKDTEINCWLGTLPDLDQSRENVRNVQKAHLKKLIDMGVGGFRFDAAKHMPENIAREYINFINTESKGTTWNYLEVIQDGDTSANDYRDIAAVTDFILYSSMKNVFVFGDLRSFPPKDIPDSRSVTFGQNHDTIRKLNPIFAINPYDDISDAHLADAFVLARESGTPLIFNEDNLVPYIPFGVTFRRIMHDRAKEGKNVKENILRVVDSPIILIMERGTEGFFVLNKALGKFDIPVLDMTQTNLDGCYRELRNNFTVHIQKREGDTKFVSRWATRARGGMEVHGRDALYFIREPIELCP